ncbi:MAG: hypothetical protein WC602_04610 [archaeon]
MAQLTIKIGGKLEKDLKKVFYNPKKGKPGSHTIHLKNPAELSEMLSPKRLALLRYIIRHQAEKKTIGELANELKRKQEAISRDANLLAKYSLVRKVKDRQTVYLKPLYRSLNIQLAGA